MSSWTECVIDASFEPLNGAFTYCPIEGDIDGDFQVVIGMTYVSDRPPAKLKLVAIVHPDGQEAADEFCLRHAALLEALKL